VVYVEVLRRDRLMSVSADGGPTPLGDSAASQLNGAFSPDGRWLAYEESGQSGQNEVYVRGVSGAGGRRQVSADGGSQPRWTRGGREIVYRKGAAVFAASFQPATGEVGTPTLLFRKADAGRLGGGRTIGYDVTPDGARFLLVTPVERPDAQSTVVVLDWLDVLRARAPR
jgi:hypothetical protein